MRWPFSRKSRDADDSAVQTLPVSTLIRWFIYDIGFEHPNDLATKLALLPVSDEGDEKERADSTTRLVQLTTMVPFIQVMAAINAKAALELQAEVFEAVGIGFTSDSPEYESLLNFYEKISLTAILTSLSSANQLGLVDIYGVHTSVEEY